MKKVTYLILIIAFALTTMSMHRATDPDLNCNILHNGTFIYADEQGDAVKVVITGKRHTEYHKGGKYYIKSELHWDNDCQYTAKIVKATLPGFPYKKGTVMRVLIDNVDGNAVFCTGYINEESFSSKLIKTEKIPSKSI
jgi:hypothetical protein